jgi:hypothetical protein
MERINESRRAAMAEVRRSEETHVETEEGVIETAHCIRLSIEKGLVGSMGNYVPTGVAAILDGGREIVLTARDIGEREELPCRLCGTMAPAYYYSILCKDHGWIHLCSQNCWTTFHNDYTGPQTPTHGYCCKL